MNGLLLDTRQAFRALLRAPAVTAAAVISIAIGIGATTTVFTWMDSLVLHPYPAIPGADRLVGLNVAGPGDERWPLSYPTYKDWRDNAGSFSGMAAWTVVRLASRTPDDVGSAPATVMLTSGNYFNVLGVRARLGRMLSPDDERAPNGVGVLTARSHVRRFGGRPSVLGSTVFLNGQPITIVGVAPEGFEGTYVGVAPDMFVPLTLNPLLTGTKSLDDRNARWLQSIARLAPSADQTSAERELDAVARRLSASVADKPVTGARVLLTREQFLGSIVFPLFSAMLVITGLVLVVACANVAGLLLVRASARTHELAVRGSLGASRGRLVRMMVAESAALAVVGTLLGGALAYAMRGALYAFAPAAPFPIALPIAFNMRVLGFAAAAAAMVTLLCGLSGALRAARVAPASALRDAGRAVAGRSRLRSSLVATQLAFSFACLAVAGLFVRGLERALRVDPGFRDPERVLLVGTDFAAARLFDSAGVVALDDVLRRVRALPGVTSATAASMVPLGFGSRRIVSVKVQDRALDDRDDNTAERALVAPSYFETMGTRVLSGRAIGDGDRASTERVVLVSEAFVRRFWNGEDAIGRRVDAGNGWATVVGVVADARLANLSDPPRPVAYFAMRQWFAPSVTLHVRTAGDPRALVTPVTKALTAVHVDLQALQPRTLADHAGAATFVQRAGSGVLSAFGVVALVLAGVGLFGALSYTWLLRSREIAIRMALGADASRIRGLVGRHALRVAGAGIGAGVVLALGLGRLVSARVSTVSVVDPVAYGTSLMMLVAAVALATWGPLRRAARVPPAAVLHG